MAITKEQWKALEVELSHAYGHAKLTCDGYDVTLEVRMVDTLQYGIVVFVDGFSRGKWLVEDCEERRRFLRPVTSFVWSAGQRAKLLKIWGGKRAPKDKVEHVNRKVTWYSTYWTSVKPLRRHIEKNNQELRVVSIGGTEVARAESTSA